MMILSGPRPAAPPPLQTVANPVSDRYRYRPLQLDRLWRLLKEEEHEKRRSITLFNYPSLPSRINVTEPLPPLEPSPPLSRLPSLTQSPSSSLTTSSPRTTRAPSIPILIRPRYIPIVIPDHASPFRPRPDPPSTLWCNFSSLREWAESITGPPPPDMSRAPLIASRTSTLDSTGSVPSPLLSQPSYALRQAPPPAYMAEPTRSPANAHLPTNHDHDAPRRENEINQLQSREVAKGGDSGPGAAAAISFAAAAAATAGLHTALPAQGSTALSGLVCNVHRTTGREPHPLVGATTTVLGDRLYVFGGRILSRTRPQLTADLYELDLIRRHWTKVDTRGEIPAPRYFHSVCALGDSKLVCYGGMSPAAAPSALLAGGGATPATGSGASDAQPEVMVMSDIHIYDVNTRTWTFIATPDTPQGRYAHCATILPSSAMFTSAQAPMSAIHHNASTTGNPNQGSIGVGIDGTGGAEMVVVGGQDSGNQYIEQISVFNLRSLRWQATDSLGKSCGAYRSVVTPLSGMSAARIGRGAGSRAGSSEGKRRTAPETEEGGSSMLIYSNYNFLDVKLELQVRLPDGTLTEKAMRGDFSPPGLRFPNGGVIDRHFVISGTYLTSSKQEYALWALDLDNLTWSRIDAGGNHFSQGSWNRGVLWKRRNTFVVLGNRKRSLVEDYNHRRINFSNVCMVELEAFGMYENPRRTSPTSGYVSASSPLPPSAGLSSPSMPASGKAGWPGRGRPHSTAAEEMGMMALGMNELADMDFLAMGGERVPVNSRIVAQRWGPYFIRLLQKGAARNEAHEQLQYRTSPGGGVPPPPSSRNSSTTITPSIGGSSISTARTLMETHPGTHRGSTSGHQAMDPQQIPTAQQLPPSLRPRTLYLPHTHSTLQTLVHYLYTSSLPPPHHVLCTPQILCSLLQIARPYQIDGLLEAVVERLHQVLDGRNAAAVFNAAAMAAGGGEGTTPLIISRSGQTTTTTSQITKTTTTNSTSSTLIGPGSDDAIESIATDMRRNLRLGSVTANGPTAGMPSSSTSSLPPTSAVPLSKAANGHPIAVSQSHSQNLSDTESADEDASSATSSSTSTNTTGSDNEYSEAGGGGGGGGTNGVRNGRAARMGHEREIWSGTLSSVVGLQKRGLRGLMEGRRIRERGKSTGQSGQPVHMHVQSAETAQAASGGGAGGGNVRVGLGIA